MGLKFNPASLHWSQPSVPHSPFSTMASAIAPPSSIRPSSPINRGGNLFCRDVYRSRSRDNRNSGVPIIRRAYSTSSLDSFSEVARDDSDAKFSEYIKFDSSIVRTLTLSSSTSNANTASEGGHKDRGGGKCKSGTGGDVVFVESNYGISSISPTRTSGEESVCRRASASFEEEDTSWSSVLEKALRMQGASRDEASDQETIQRFDAKTETYQDSEYLKTELLYQVVLAQEPNSPLLLANYAQFLYLVAQDYDRAEDLFKRATKIEPKDAEALNKYANYLWVVREDLWAAEETFLEAISAEPDNSYYAANYAHFLWNTGAEDTCFPLA